MPVYFVSAQRVAVVKIGYTGNLHRCFLDLQTRSPDRLFVQRVVEGTRTTARNFHDQFKALRVHGDWFRFDPAMLIAEPYHAVTGRTFARHDKHLCCIGCPKCPDGIFKKGRQ